MRAEGWPSRPAGGCSRLRLRSWPRRRSAHGTAKRVTGPEEWDAIARRCTEDVLIHLALGRFRRRPPMSALPLGLQRDIRAFFGSHAKACLRADDRLFPAGD